MSIDIEQMIIQHSVQDVIRILENEPVQRDLIVQITAVQILNRTSLAHLSIERAMKFLVQKAGGPLVQNHHLGKRLRELTEHRPESAEFLRRAFVEAVKHYRYSPKSPRMGHLGSLDSYFTLVGSDKAFNDLRYWELNQSMNDVALPQIQLSLHLEILHAIDELLLVRGRMDTVVDRVERAVHKTMWSGGDLTYGPGTPKESSVRAYIGWLSGFSSCSEALAAAVEDNFQIGDHFMVGVANGAYRTLLSDKDPAVSYFASSLDVLPTQPRDAIPCVKWLGPEKHQRGTVSTPSGVYLGIIERGLDGIWYITPSRSGPVVVAAKARTQTDARCYLAEVLTQEAEVQVGGELRSLRLVGSDHRPIESNPDRSDTGDTDNDIWTHKITLWDGLHGINISERVRIKVPPRAAGGLVHMLQGMILEIAGPEVYVSGTDWIDVERDDAG